MYVFFYATQSKTQIILMEENFMTGRVMDNVNKKLSKSREMCPGLSEEVYALTDYMAVVANECLVPIGLAIVLTMALEDVKRETNGFSNAIQKEKFKYLVEHRTQVLAQAVYVPQIIDAIADEDYAKEFRTICKEVLGFDTPKRTEKYNLNAELDGDYPEYVKVAVNWWANAISNPKFDKGDDRSSGTMAFLSRMMVNCKKSISQKQLNIFKKELANLIVTQMKQSWSGECTISVDYNPDEILSSAAQKAGLDTGFGFPWKTGMRISQNKVTASAGRRGAWEKA